MEFRQVELTNHAYKRRKRLGASKKLLPRLAERAIFEGKVRSEFSGPLRNYLDNYALDYLSGGTDLYVLHHNIFVIKNKSLLITTWAVPSKYRKFLNEKPSKRPNRHDIR